MKIYPVINHIDGKWHTSNEIILGFNCQIKMQEGKGSKIHIWNEDNSKVLKTFRFSFALKEHLIAKATNWIKENMK